MNKGRQILDILSDQVLEIDQFEFSQLTNLTVFNRLRVVQTGFILLFELWSWQVVCLINFFRLDSTISHVGFLLLSLAICSAESVQAFLFYLTQYTISNLNAFIILIVIGFSLNFYNNSNKEHEELKDKINSPVRGLGNPYLSRVTTIQFRKHPIIFWYQAIASNL